GTSGSGAGWSAAGRRDSHPAAAACAGGRRPRWLLRRSTGSWISPPSDRFGDRRAARPPFTGRLRVDPVAPGELSQARLTMLYRPTDRLCRGGAAVKNLAPSASFVP